MKLSRSELRLACLLLAGILCMGIGFAWASHEASTIVSALDEAGHDISALATERIVTDIHKANRLRMLGACIFCPAYLWLLVSAHRYRNASLLLKGFLWFPAGCYCFMGMQAIYSARMWLGIVPILFAALLVLPNHLLTNTRWVLASYIGFLNGVLLLGIAVACYQVTQLAFPIRHVALLVGVTLTLVSAVSLSPWLAYLKRQQAAAVPRGMAAYRWSCTVLLAAAYGCLAAASTADAFQERAERQRWQEQESRFEAQLGEAQRLGTER